MVVNLQNLALILGLVSTIVGMGIALFKLFSRFEKIERQSEHRKEENEILLRTMLGILDGLIEQGSNGPVKQARKELIDYMSEREK